MSRETLAIEWNIARAALKGIERQLKIHNKREAERDARRDARQVPPADPMGYTE